MNYKGKLTEILKKPEIWGNDFKEINDDVINEVKKEMASMDKSQLSRMLYILECGYIKESEIANMYISVISIALSVVGLVITVDPNKAFDKYFVIIYFLIIILLTIHANKHKIPKNIQRNNKIKCMEIAVREILEEDI